MAPHSYAYGIHCDCGTFLCIFVYYIWISMVSHTHEMHIVYGIVTLVQGEVTPTDNRVKAATTVGQCCSKSCS